MACSETERVQRGGHAQPDDAHFSHGSDPVILSLKSQYTAGPAGLTPRTRGYGEGIMWAISESSLAVRGGARRLGKLRGAMNLRALVTAFVAFAAFGQTQRPLQLQDLVSWKRIAAATVSNDGEWFAYRQGPAEGDAEVIIRNLKSGKDLKFPIGDPGSTAPPITATPTPIPDPTAVADPSPPA